MDNISQLLQKLMSSDQMPSKHSIIWWLGCIYDSRRKATGDVLADLLGVSRHVRVVVALIEASHVLSPCRLQHAPHALNCTEHKGWNQHKKWAEHPEFPLSTRSMIPSRHYLIGQGDPTHIPGLCTPILALTWVEWRRIRRKELHSQASAHGKLCDDSTVMSRVVVSADDDLVRRHWSLFDDLLQKDFRIFGTCALRLRGYGSINSSTNFCCCTLWSPTVLPPWDKLYRALTNQRYWGSIF